MSDALDSAASRWPAPGQRPQESESAVAEDASGPFVWQSRVGPSRTAPCPRVSATRHNVIVGPVTGFATDRELLQAYLDLGISDIVSVPCSITDSWQWLAAEAASRGELRLAMTCHEGNLAGIAAGRWFGTGQPALVHMQNSGLLNASDGFVSMANPAMYAIPIAALVTWRGSGPADTSEPHQEIGRRTEALTEVIFGDRECLFGTIDGAGSLAALRASAARALAGGIGVMRLAPAGIERTERGAVSDGFGILPSGHLETLCKVKGEQSVPAALRFPAPVARDQALRAVAEAHPSAALVVCNGFTSRAAQAVVDRPGIFYNIGYMGGTLAIGWGLATAQPHLQVVVIDGDQNALMSTMKDHLAWDYPPNLHWYILDNHIGASVGTARSVPLSPFHRALARVIETRPDVPGAFKHPRVRAAGANLPANLAAGDSTNLADLARGFRAWVAAQQRGV